MNEKQQQNAIFSAIFSSKREVPLIAKDGVIKPMPAHVQVIVKVFNDEGSSIQAQKTATKISDLETSTPAILKWVEGRLEKAKEYEPK